MLLATWDAATLSSMPPTGPLSLVFTTTFQIESMTGLHKDFSQNPSSFRMLSYRKLCLNVMDINKATENVTFFISSFTHWLDLIHENLEGGKHLIRKDSEAPLTHYSLESKRHCPLKHIISHNKMNNCQFYGLLLSLILKISF